jgi:hypothetical protein
MHVRLAFISLLFVAVSGAPGSEGPAPLTLTEQAELLAFIASRANTSLSALPHEIGKHCADSNGNIAAAGAKWEPTDVITDRSLPRSRLIWHATSGRRMLVHYETGGYAHSYWLLIAESGLRSDVLSRASVWEALSAPSELKRAIEQSKVLSARP